MELSQLMKSIIDMDRASVVICGPDHRILYLNPAAVKSYEKWGGTSLMGRCLLDCHNGRSREQIQKVVAWFQESPQNNMIHTFYNEKQQKDVYMVALRDETGKLIGYYEKHEYRARETAECYDFSHSLA